MAGERWLVARVELPTVTSVRLIGTVSAAVLFYGVFIASPLYDRLRGWWARRAR